MKLEISKSGSYTTLNLRRSSRRLLRALLGLGILEWKLSYEFSISECDVHTRTPSISLGLQVVQSKSYFYTLGPKV